MGLDFLDYLGRELFFKKDRIILENIPYFKKGIFELYYELYLIVTFFR